MRVSVETTSGLERKVTVALPADSLQKLIDEQVRNTAGKVELPGFRKGKVPLRVVRQRFGDKLLQDAASSLLQTSLQEAVTQEQLAPAGSMNVDIVTLDVGKDFEYAATFEIFPEFELAPFSTLRIRVPQAEIAEADIDNTVEQLRHQQTAWHAVERPAQIDDRVLVDYSVEADGETLQSREGAQHVVAESGSDMDRAIVGMAATETRTFPVTLRVSRERAATVEADEERGAAHHDDQSNVAAAPDVDEASEQASTGNQDAPTPDAGATDADDAFETRNAIGKVTLRGVEEPQLPELDDAFFDSFGVAPEGDRMAAFRSAVRGRMEVELDQAARRASKREVLAALAAAHEFELPKAQLEAEVAEQKLRFAATLGEFPPNFEPVVRESAAETIRHRIMVRAIALRESIAPDDDRVEARIAEIASGYEQPVEVRRFLRSNEEQLNRIEAAVLEDQIVEKVLADANVATVAMPYAAVVGNQPLPEDTQAETDEETADDAKSPDPASAPTPTEPSPDSTDGAADEAPEAKPKRGLMRRLFGRGDANT